jgi:hypothetical protein
VTDEKRDYAEILAQIEDSLRAIKLRIIDYQLQLFLVSLRKQLEITDSSADEKERAATTALVSRVKPLPRAGIGVVQQAHAPVTKQDDPLVSCQIP